MPKNDERFINEYTKEPEHYSQAFKSFLKKFKDPNEKLKSGEELTSEEKQYWAQLMQKENGVEGNIYDSDKIRHDHIKDPGYVAALLSMPEFALGEEAKNDLHYVEAQMAHGVPMISICMESEKKVAQEQGENESESEVAQEGQENENTSEKETENTGKKKGILVTVVDKIRHSNEEWASSRKSQEQELDEIENEVEQLENENVTRVSVDEIEETRKENGLEEPEIEALTNFRDQSEIGLEKDGRELE